MSGSVDCGAVVTLCGSWVKSLSSADGSRGIAWNRTVRCKIEVNGNSQE